MDERGRKKLAAASALLEGIFALPEIDVPKAIRGEGLNDEDYVEVVVPKRTMKAGRWRKLRDAWNAEVV